MCTQWGPQSMVNPDKTEPIEAFREGIFWLNRPSASCSYHKAYNYEDICIVKVSMAFTLLAQPLSHTRNDHIFNRQYAEYGLHVQLLKKLSQCLAVLQRLMWCRSNKLYNNLKIIGVILCHLSFLTSPEARDLDQNWLKYKQNKTSYHWDSFLTLYYFTNTHVINSLYDPLLP